MFVWRIFMCNSFPKINSWKKKDFFTNSTPWFIGQTCWTVPDAAPISEAWAWANKTWNLVTLQSLVTASAWAPTEWRDQYFHQDWYWAFLRSKFPRLRLFWSPKSLTLYRYFFRKQTFWGWDFFYTIFFRLIPGIIYRYRFFVTLWWALDKHDREIKPGDCLHPTATLRNSTSIDRRKLYNTQQLFRVKGDLICMRK